MTVLPTTLDLLNASKYAGYLYMVNSTREYFKNKGIILKEKRVDWEPDLLAGLAMSSILEPKIELSFDETSCKAVSCFNWIKFRRCYETDKPQIVDDGVNKYEACQEACTKFKTLQNTIWKDGKCKLLNLGLKTFCLIPAKRSHTLGYFNKQPPFRWDEEVSACYNNDAYCTHFGMRLTASGECDKSDFMKVFHFVFGETITKLFANEIYYPSKKYRSGWEEVDNLPFYSPNVPLEKSPIQFMKTDNYKTIQLADDDYYSGKNVSIRILKYLGESILVALGIELGVRLTPALLSFISSYVSSIAFEEILPPAIYVLGAGIATAFEALATNGLIVAVVGTISSTVGALLSVANPILLVVGAASVAGFIIDQTLEGFTHTQTDLKNFISAANLRKICEQANNKYAYLTSGKQKFENLVELEPIVMWSQNVTLNEKDPERLKYIMYHSAHYLRYLKYNSIGQLINYGEDVPVKKLSVIPEPYKETIPPEVTSYLFDTPDMSKYLLWGTLIFLFVGSTYAFTFYHHLFWLLVVLISFILVCYDLITWWTANSTYSGNILYVYDKFFNE